MSTKKSFIQNLPKAELHLHLEGSLEPEMLMELALKNRIDIPFDTVDDIKKAYQFKELQDFLDIYYAGMGVLQTEQDFYDLTTAYLKRCHEDGVVHTEVFFDPQGHTARGLAFRVAADGICKALSDGEKTFGISSFLIMCFLRHLPEEDAFQTLETAQPYFDDGRMIGVGLDSSEVGNPPANFERVFKAAHDRGLKTVAHAGEEGPASYVRDAIDLLKVDRIDHGNRCMDDPELVKRIVDLGLALTVCPLSNQRLCVVDDMKQHPLKQMMDAGLHVTINSDDPAYFGGYVLDNYVAVAEALDLSETELATLARNSITGSFLSEAEKTAHLARL